MPRRRATAPTRYPRTILERMKVTTAKHSWPGVHVVLAKIGGQQVGYMEVEESEGPSGQTFTKVAFVEATKKGLGIGTKLYERAAALACRQRAPLISDESRTAASQGFWEKQARKGRAYCVPGSGRGTKLGVKFGVTGSWSCGQYALTCPAPKSLAAAPRRRRRA